jgi:hypothetical protein
MVGSEDIGGTMRPSRPGAMSARARARARQLRLWDWSNEIRGNGNSPFVTRATPCITSRSSTVTQGRPCFLQMSLPESGEPVSQACSRRGLSKRSRLIPNMVTDAAS